MSIHRTELKQFTNPTIKEQEFKPGTEREVCRSLLPKEGAKNGECVRFRVSSKFGGGGQSFVSRPFAVGGGPDEVLACKTH